MGILSDFFVATPDQAARYASRIDEDDEGDAITALLNPLQLKGLTGLEMGTLWAILEGVEWDVGRHMLESIPTGEDAESWLDRFPDELTRLLARTNASAIESACAAWADTDELRCSPSDVLPVLRDIQALTIQAEQQGRSVYLWGCL